MGIKKIAASLAALAIASTTAASVMTPTVASAGESSQCIASLVTLTKTDADTGATLANAEFEVKLPDGITALDGDQKSQTDAFKDAFDAAAADFAATAEGSAWAAAQQDKLGTDNFSGYPVDMTGEVDFQTQAMESAAADEDGKIADLKTDAQTRLDAVTAALDANPTLETVDPVAFEHATKVRDGLAAVVAGADEYVAAAGAGDWAAFTAAYEKMTSADNWHYGLAHDLSVEYMDSVAGSSFSDMNAAGAEAIGAESTIKVTTNAEGIAEFTIFGVKDGTYADRGTRGDVSCSQLAGDAVEIKAPAGYVRTEGANSFASSTLEEGATASLTVTNKPFESPVPDVPVKTTTGF